jgi:hypothetical protein
MEDHWLPGFNFNFEEWSEGDRYETLAIDARYQPHARSGPRRIRGCDRRETYRPLHHPQPHARCHLWATVQNGQFPIRLSENGTHLPVACQAHDGIESAWVNVIVGALTMKQTPLLQSTEPTDDRGTWHVHVRSQLGDRERPMLNLSEQERHADEHSLQAFAKGFANRRIMLV